MTPADLPEIRVLIARETPDAWMVVVIVPGFPPVTRYSVPLEKVVETIRVIRGEVLQ